MRWIVICIISLLLGCKSESREQHRVEESHAQQAADDQQCRSYGATVGSDSYVACRMQLDNRRAQADEARRQRVLQMLINRQQ